jgi:hypothetical protein
MKQKTKYLFIVRNGESMGAMHRVEIGKDTIRKPIYGGGYINVNGTNPVTGEPT